MSLPAREQRALDGIEIMLQASETGLQSMFALFTSLSKDAGKPRTEDLGTRSLLRRPLPARRAARRHARNARRRSAPRGQHRTGRPGTIARIVTLVLLMIALAAAFCAVLISGLSPRPCGPAAGARSSAPAVSQARTCQPAPAPHRN
jgi:hypothetical protein